MENVVGVKPILCKHNNLYELGRCINLYTNSKIVFIPMHNASQSHNTFESMQRSLRIIE